MGESNRIEYKRSLTDSLEREAVAFLNYRDGGVIYIGVDDKTGVPVGLEGADQLQLQIKDRLKNNIQPSVLGLFDVLLDQRDGKNVIKITLASGPEKPFYLKKQGLSEKGCFMRVGSAVEPMPIRMIEDLFARRTRNSIGKIKAPRQDLTFEQLKIYYHEAGFDLVDKFAANLELLTEEQAYNYAAYLLADRNGISIKVARYRGTDRVDLIENNEYGYCSLIKATKQVLDKLAVENRTRTRITPRERIDLSLIQPIALREAVINAIIHNDYSNEIPPKFELFDDRLEITSAGGIPQGLSQSEFFNGYSVPRNKEMMRVFKDLELVEYLGSGLPRILKAYSSEIFTFSENFVRIVFPYTTQETAQETAQEKIIACLKAMPGITRKQLAAKVGLSESGVKYHLEKLKAAGKIYHVGPTKSGIWQVVERGAREVGGINKMGINKALGEE